MNRFIRISLAALIGFAAPLQAFGWGTVTGPRGGTATTGPRGAGYAQGPNGATAARGPGGAGYAQGPNGAAAVPARPGSKRRCCGRSRQRNCLTSMRPLMAVRFMRKGSACLQAMGCGTLLRCRCRGRGTWHRNCCGNATPPTVTSLVLVLVEPNPQPGVLGLLCSLVDEIPSKPNR